MSYWLQASAHESAIPHGFFQRMIGSVTIARRYVLQCLFGVLTNLFCHYPDSVSSVNLAEGSLRIATTHYDMIRYENFWLAIMADLATGSKVSSKAASLARLISSLLHLGDMTLLSSINL